MAAILSKIDREEQEHSGEILPAEDRSEVAENLGDRAPLPHGEGRYETEVLRA